MLQRCACHKFARLNYFAPTGLAAALAGCNMGPVQDLWLATMHEVCPFPPAVPDLPLILPLHSQRSQAAGACRRQALQEHIQGDKQGQQLTPQLHVCSASSRKMHAVEHRPGSPPRYSWYFHIM